MSTAVAATPVQRHYSIPLFAGDVLVCALMACIALGNTQSWVPTVMRTTGVLLVLLYLPCHLFYRLKFSPELLLFGLFIVWAGATGFVVALDWEACWGYVRLLGQEWAMALAICGLCMAKRSPSIAFFAIVVWAVCLALYSRATGFYEAGLAPSLRTAVAVPWNYNGFGFIMLEGIVGLSYFWGMKRGRYLHLLRLALVPLAVFLAFSLVSSTSRKAFAGLLLYAVLWMWFCYRKQILRNLRAVVVVAAALGGAGLLANYALRETRMGARAEAAWEEGGLGEERTGLYRQAIVMFLENPVTGVGLGNFAVLSEERYYSHSEYAEILATTGIVGVLLYFPLYVILWRRLTRIARTIPDPEVRYDSGVFRATILTMAAVGIGAPLFIDVIYWSFMSAVIGYACALDWSRSAVPAAATTRASPSSALNLLPGRLSP